MSRTAGNANDRGFTLVEIVIAVVLVGILSAVVVVGVASLTSRGSTAACQASLDAARTAANVHLTSTGSQAATYGELVSTGSLTVSSGVTIDASGTRLVGDGWSLTMSGSPPTFACEGPAPGAAPLSGYAGAVMADSPISYWRLDETSGTSAADLGTAGATGTRAVAATNVSSPLGVGSATTFSSPSPAGITATIGAGTQLDRGVPLTLEAWIRPSDASQNGGIIEKSVGTTVNTQYLLFLEGGYIVFRVANSNGSWSHLYTGHEPAVGQWSHVVATADGTTMRVYVNGTQVGTLAASGSLRTGAGTLFIGQLGSNVYPFRGSIDEVAVYGTALSAARVTAHYNAGLAPN